MANNIIIAGDFNAHNLAWESSHNDLSGINILSAVTSSDLVILNKGNPTRLTLPLQNTSAINLTIVNISLLLYCHWSVLKDAYNSDHLPIVTVIDIPPKYSTRFCHKIERKTSDWKVFKEILSNNQNKITDAFISSKDNVDHQLKTINSAIIEAILLSTPSCKASNSHVCKPPLRSFKGPSPAPWWNEDCAVASKNRKTATKAFRHLPSMQNYIELRKTEAISKKVFQKAKRESWTKFCESIQFKTSPEKIWRVIKAFKNRNLNNFTTNSSRLNDQEKEAQNIINQLCPDSCLPQTTISKQPILPREDLLSRDITVPEILDIIDGLNTRSSPGMDGISYKTISHLPDYLIELFCKLFNNVLYSGKFPEEWRKYLIILIPKSVPSKFRPISLFSCLLKIMEKIWAKKLQWFCEHNNFFNKEQYGFRKGKSCQDNLAILSTDIWLGISEMQFVPCLFLDITGAFDNLQPIILHNILLSL